MLAMPGSKCLEITWEFPKIRGTLFWGPYNRDPTISGTVLGSPIFGNSHILTGLAFGFRVAGFRKPQSGNILILMPST